MNMRPSVAVVDADDARLLGRFRLLPLVEDEASWLEEHGPVLGPDPQVNRFDKPGTTDPHFEVIEVHPESPQLTVASDADVLVALYPVGWSPGGSEQPDVAVRVPAGYGSIIEPGVWHSGVCALGDSPVVAVFRARTLEDATEVHHLGQGIAFVI